MAPLDFRPAGASRDAVTAAFRVERAKIRRLLPRAEVVHTGATSVAEALTRGDLDIHVRVRADEFVLARDVLASVNVGYRREMWTPEFATFVVRDASIPTGIALTAIRGEHDRRFVTAWDRLRRDATLLRAYNELKLKHEGAADDSAYEAEKAAFFTALSGS